MISEMCRWYGWTPEYLLKMPILTFFAFRNQSMKELGVEGVQKADLSFLPAANFERYKEVRESYMRLISPSKPVVAVERTRVMEWDDPNTQNSLWAIFTDYRISKYGH